jgi:hypothetical protein
MNYEMTVRLQHYSSSFGKRDKTEARPLFRHTLQSCSQPRFLTYRTFALDVDAAD